MTASFAFERPAGLEATEPPEARGIRRDGVRLLVSDPERVLHRRFDDLPTLLRADDLLVVNDSATVPASLAARATFGSFRLNLSTWYGRSVWLAEPRWSFSRPGPLPLREGDRLEAGGLAGRVVAEYPGLPRLLFVHLEGDVASAMRLTGEPIRYGYVRAAFPLTAYQTIFAARPGSAEMPSAGRPFSSELVGALRACGIAVAPLTLHTSVSSVEIEPGTSTLPVFPEPFEVPAATVDAVGRCRAAGGRVIAVGTTVVRALESAAVAGRLRPIRGFTRTFIRPGRRVETVDGLITGLHEPRTTHLAMLEALVGPEVLRRAYAAAITERYLWHEFGDSHLMFRSGAA